MARTSAGLLAASDEGPSVCSVCRNPDRELVRTLAPNERVRTVLVPTVLVRSAMVRSAMVQNVVFPNATLIATLPYSVQIVGFLIEMDARRCLVVKVWRVVRCGVHSAEVHCVEELRFVVEELRSVVAVLRCVVATLQREMAEHCAGVARKKDWMVDCGVQDATTRFHRVMACQLNPNFQAKPFDAVARLRWRRCLERPLVVSPTAVLHR